MEGNFRRIVINTDVPNLNELRRIKRVSDMMITAHAVLKERYRNISLLSDVLLFTCAAVLCVMTFADRDMLIKYFGSWYNLCIGIMAIGSFIYSFISNQLEWKVKAERHKTAFEKYVNLKFECTNLLKIIDKNEQVDINKFLEKFYTLTPSIISIPEKLFLKCKKHHVLKVFISKYLDEHQSSSILLLKIKLWFRDNCKSLNISRKN
jgi:hypothetical protein